MKMIIAIIRDSDSENVSQALVSAGLRVTRVASTGGFLRRGSTTLLIGVEDDKVDLAIQVVKDSTTPTEDAELRRATLFVLNVERYAQL